MSTETYGLFRKEDSVYPRPHSHAVTLDNLIEAGRCLDSDNTEYHIRCEYCVEKTYMGIKYITCEHAKKS